MNTKDSYKIGDTYFYGDLEFRVVDTLPNGKIHIKAVKAPLVSLIITPGGVSEEGKLEAIGAVAATIGAVDPEKVASVEATTKKPSKVAKLLQNFKEKDGGYDFG